MENFEAAVALNFTYDNFCNIHGAIRCTSAIADGIEKSQWSVVELVITVANKKYVNRLTPGLEHLHNCPANWVSSHPKAKRAHDWNHKDGADDKDDRFVTVLELPPRKSAQNAVKVSIMVNVKERSK